MPPTPPREDDQCVSWADASWAGTDERLPGQESVCSPARRLCGCADSNLATLSSARSPEIWRAYGSIWRRRNRHVTTCGCAQNSFSGWPGLATLSWLADRQLGQRPDRRVERREVDFALLHTQGGIPRGRGNGIGGRCLGVSGTDSGQLLIVRWNGHRWIRS